MTCVLYGIYFVSSCCLCCCWLVLWTVFDRGCLKRKRKQTKSDECAEKRFDGGDGYRVCDWPWEGESCLCVWRLPRGQTADIVRATGGRKVRKEGRSWKTKGRKLFVGALMSRGLRIIQFRIVFILLANFIYVNFTNCFYALFYILFRLLLLCIISSTKVLAAAVLPGKFCFHRHTSQPRKWGRVTRAGGWLTVKREYRRGERERHQEPPPPSKSTNSLCIVRLLDIRTPI